jgi:hypothetical protein
MLLCAALLLTAAAELDAYRLPEEPYYPDGQTPSATGDFGYVDGKHCNGSSIHPYLHTLDEVSAAGCYKKCGPESACAGSIAGGCVDCTGYMPAYDTAESDALCLSPTSCQTLCKSMPDCYGYDAYSGADHYRCVLKTHGCLKPVLNGELVSSPTVTFYFKDQEVDAECPLGKGVHVAFKRDTAQTQSGKTDAEIDAYGVVGIYGESTDASVSKVYTRVDGSDRIVQHVSGCGWVVEKAACTYVTPGSLCWSRVRSLQSTCEDDAAAVAAVFGPQASDAGICGAKEWAKAPGGYCAFPLFAALCPGSCGIAACDADVEDAAADLLAILRTEGTGCAAATKYCSHPVVNAVCRATCAGWAQTATRRGNRVVPADFALAFRARLARRPEPPEPPAEPEDKRLGRRLGWDINSPYGSYSLSFYEVYYTWDPAVDPSPSLTCSYATTGSLTSTTDKQPTLYDVFKLHESLPAQQWTYDCPVETYRTLGKMYCPQNNLGTRGTVGIGGSGYSKGSSGIVLPSLEQEMCVAKCPGGSYCDGYDANLAADSNAVCLPRSMCEALCDSIAECGSFDMHKSLNRCYLNEHYCDPGRNPYDYPESTDFDVEMKIYTPSDEYDFVYKAKSPTVYTTNEMLACNAADYAAWAPDVIISDMDESCTIQCAGPSAGTTASTFIDGAGSVGSEGMTLPSYLEDYYSGGKPSEHVHTTEAVTALPKGYLVKEDRRGYLVGGRLEDPPSPGSEHKSTGLVFGMPKLVIADTDVNWWTALPIAMGALAPNYEGVAKEGTHYDWVYAIRMPAGYSPVLSGDGLLLKKGYVAETVLSVEVEETIAVPLDYTISDPYAIRAYGTKTMILGFDLSAATSASQGVTADVVVVVVDASGGATTITLGQASADYLPYSSSTSLSIGMAPVSTGVAVLVLGTTPSLYYVTDSGISNTVVLTSYGFPSSASYGFISAVKDSKVAVVSPGSGSVDQLVTCEPDGCDDPRSLDETWKQSTSTGIQSRGVVCVTGESCIVHMVETDVSGMGASNLALVRMDDPVNAGTKFLLGGFGYEPDDVYFTDTQPVALSESHIFLAQMWATSLDEYNKWSPVAQTADQRAYGFVAWEKALTWSGRFLQSAYETSCPAGLTGEEICGGRQACEQVCDRLDKCAGFTMDEDELCIIYSTCENTATSSTLRTVLKDQTVPCTVTVKDAVLPESLSPTYDAAPLNSEYVQKDTHLYVSATNETAIYYDSAHSCMGYVLGLNTATAYTIFAITYLDASGQVQTAFQSWFRTTYAVPDLENLVMCDALTGPAVPGQSSLFTCSNALVKAICYRSCTPLTEGTVAESAASYHFLFSTKDYPTATVASWAVDDDNAFSGGYGGSCAGRAGYGPIVADCNDEIQRFFCPYTCSTPYSEVYSAEVFSCLPYDDPNTGVKHDDFTPVFRTYANGSDVAYKMPQAYDDGGEYGTVGDKYRVSSYGHPQCMTSALGFSTDSLQKDVLTTTELFPVKAEVADFLELRPDCAEEALCPTLTTCVESFYVFERELEHMLAGASLSKDGAFFPAHFTGLDKPFTTIANPCRFTVPFVNCPARMAALHSSNWVDFTTSPIGLPAPDFTTESETINYAFPKHILTAQRATGFIRTALYDFGKEIFRPVPGATRLRFTKFGSAAETVVVSLSGSESWWTTFNYDTVYALPEGYASFVSDVIRLEAFAYDTSSGSYALQSDFITFEISAPGYSEIEVYRFGFDGTVGKISEYSGSVAPSASAENSGWFTVTVHGYYANADFVAVVDLDECALPADELAFPCEAPKDGGKCVNNFGSYECQCIAGYKGQDGTLPGMALAKGVQCVVDQYEASPTAFLLYHEEDAEYGLEISELKLYDGSIVKSDGTTVCMGSCQDGSMSEDCAFGYKTDESTTSYAQKLGPWSYAMNVDSSDFFPEFGPSKVFDNDKDTVFKSERLTLSRADGTGAWIYWEVDAGVDVECVEVVVYCTSEQPKKFVLHRGKVGEVEKSAAFGSRGLPFTAAGKPGFMTFVAKTFTPGEVKLDLAVPCGIKDAQYFGEKLLDYTGVLTVCACEQLCLEHVDEGCATYKWYSETSHCFLQKDIFEGTDPDSEVLPEGALAQPRGSLRSYYVEGRGWWKRPLSYGWPGWFTGAVGPIPFSFSTTPEVLALDTAFSLTVAGVGFPFDDEIKEDSGARQRIKIVPSSAVCGIAVPPPEVTGVDCTNEYTCTPRPSSYTRTNATWSGLQLSASKAEMTYKVCYCGGECWAVENWQEVPGVLELDASAFSFEITSSDSPAATDTSFTFKVSRPPFSGTSDKDTWKLKLVDSRYDCTALGATSFCGGATDCGTPTSSFGPDEVSFSVSSDGKADAGDYLVCISEGSGFSPVPQASGRYLKLSGSGAAHPAGFFRDQSFSAKAGTDVKLSAAGYGLDGSVEELTLSESCSSGPFVDMTKSSHSDSATVFSGSIPDDWDGVYKLCQNETEIGTLSVTTRPDVGVNYVVTPGQSTSFEVTGHNLDYKKDRVMVIDCIGTCGLSEAAAGVVQPGAPVSAHYDRPSQPEVDAYEEVELFVGDWAATAESTGKYCPGNLIPIEKGTLADKHRCYPKCYANTCTGDSCFCSGYEGGYDTAESSSLCLNVEQCTDLCAQTPDCTSIDMHTSKDRCFLNTGDCATLLPDPDYNVMYKQVDANTRRMMDRGRSLSAAQVRELIAGEDPGISWDKLLRFDAVEFTAGGEFKLCFCDPSLVASGICSSSIDYKIEVGSVHATGLECLLTNPKMQRGTCVSQYYGGLRCYDDTAPTVEIPDGYVAIPDTSRSELSPKAQLLLGFCQFAPEEEAMQYSFCAQHRQFVAPVGSVPTGATPR